VTAPSSSPPDTSLSAIVLVKNEAHQIRPCLETVGFADEVIVVDTGSTDDTVAQAQACGARVIETEWRGYSESKEIGCKTATCGWILWIDADERVTPALREEILAALRRTDTAGFYIPRKAIFLGRWIAHCGWYPDDVLRLFRREAGRFSDVLVHERVLVDGPVASLTSPLIHHTDPSLEHYLTKFNRYTSLAADQLYRSGRRFRLTDLLVRPIFAFFKMYVLKRGFLDGLPGLILCGLSASYVFAKYAKLWHRWQNPEDLPQDLHR